MDKLETEIIKQYKEECFSAVQISDNLNLNSSKVRYVLDKFGVKKRTISEAIRHLNRTKFKKGAFEIKTNLSNKEEKLKVAGIMLYWGEGTKQGNSVVFSNSNSDMVVLFLKFLREICGVSEERVRALLHFYEDQDEMKLKKYWSEKMKVPISQFSKSFLHKNKNGSYNEKSVYGTISLRYSDKELLKIINNWIKEYAEKL